MELGKAKYGSGKKVFKIADGDNVFRILPPMGKLARAGKWNMYYRVEWGFKNSAGKNRPFQDVRVVNYSNQMVEVESAAHLQRESLKAQKLELTAQLRKDPTNTALKNKFAELNEDIKRFNLDAKYYMNAIDLNGQIGLLKVGSRAFKALKLEIDKLRKQGVDPLSVDNGRFFNFNRSNATGNFQDTAYQVTPYKEKVTVNGETYEKDKAHKMDESVIERLSSEAYELSSMYPVVTAAQVDRMVKQGASAVDEILGAGNDRTEGGDDESEDAGPMLMDTPKTTSVAMAVETPVSAPTPAPAAKVEVAATPAPAPAVSKGGDLSDDEFLKSIGALS